MHGGITQKKLDKQKEEEPLRDSSRTFLRGAWGSGSSHPKRKQAIKSPRFGTYHSVPVLGGGKKKNKTENSEKGSSSEGLLPFED